MISAPSHTYAQLRLVGANTHTCEAKGLLTLCVKRFTTPAVCPEPHHRSTMMEMPPTLICVSIHFQ